MSNVSLFDASDASVAESLLQAGADINAQNSELMTPLMYNDREDVAAFLIAQGADVNLFSRNGCTALHVWARKSLRIVKLLVEAGADMNVVTDSGMSVLSATIWQDIFEYLIDRGINVNLVNDQGQTIMHERLKPKYLHMVIKAGGNVHARDKAGRTPIFCYTCDESITHLINAGADVHVRDEIGNTVLHYPYVCANALEIFISKGVDVNSRNILGYTPLMFAKEAEACEVLLRHGADLNAKLANGKNAYDILSFFGYESLPVLVMNGIDCNVPEVLFLHFITII